MIIQDVFLEYETGKQNAILQKYVSDKNTLLSKIPTSRPLMFAICDDV